MKKPKFTAEQRQYFSECGKKARGVKKKFSKEEIAKREARLRKTPTHRKHARLVKRAKASA